jgi:TonB family protein
MTMLLCIGSSAQISERKVLTQVTPVYPALLKYKQIGGIVKIIATVNPSGTVKRTDALGGNPVLVTAAQNAVKMWKYAPAQSETREVVTLRFDPVSAR